MVSRIRIRRIRRSKTKIESILPNLDTRVRRCTNSSVLGSHIDFLGNTGGRIIRCNTDALLTQRAFDIDSTSSECTRSLHCSAISPDPTTACMRTTYAIRTIGTQAIRGRIGQGDADGLVGLGTHLEGGAAKAAIKNLATTEGGGF